MDVVIDSEVQTSIEIIAFVVQTIREANIHESINVIIKDKKENKEITN